MFGEMAKNNIIADYIDTKNTSLYDAIISMVR